MNSDTPKIGVCVHDGLGAIQKAEERTMQRVGRGGHRQSCADQREDECSLPRRGDVASAGGFRSGERHQRRCENTLAQGKDAGRRIYHTRDPRRISGAYADSGGNASSRETISRTEPGCVSSQNRRRDGSDGCPGMRALLRSAPRASQAATSTSTTAATSVPRSPGHRPGSGQGPRDGGRLVAVPRPSARHRERHSPQGAARDAQATPLRYKAP